MAEKAVIGLPFTTLALSYLFKDVAKDAAKHVYATAKDFNRDYVVPVIDGAIAATDTNKTGIVPLGVGSSAAYAGSKLLHYPLRVFLRDLRRGLRDLRKTRLK